MISLTCRACGRDLAAADDSFCVHCGTPVGDRPDAPDRQSARDREDQPALNRGLVTVGAVIVAVIAAGAIAATLLTALFRSPEPAPSSGGTVATTTATATSAAGAPATIWPFTRISDQPVVNTHTITEPVIDGLARYIIGGDAVTFRIDGTHCGRGTGTIQASGVVHNYSLAGQTFDYVINVQLIRVWNRAVIGELETTVEALAPFESAEWSAEMVSSRVSTIDCRITAVTVVPAG